MLRPNIPKYLHSHFASENSITPKKEHKKKKNPKAGRGRCIELGLLLCPGWQREQHLSDSLGPFPCPGMPGAASPALLWPCPSPSRARQRASRQEFAAFPLGLIPALPLRLHELGWGSELCWAELLIPRSSWGQVTPRAKRGPQGHRAPQLSPTAALLFLPGEIRRKREIPGSVAAPTPPQLPQTLLPSSLLSRLENN